ncbi:porin, partial [Sutterella wadsworthensis]|uniref:porin n=1 Tax=Sutterella wadsworthensis TaxID=40545 RepID=UPI003C6F871E
GNGYKVGFVLESGFKSDDGTLDQGGRLFGREAHIDLYSPYGTLSAGVLPIFGSVLGANGLFRAIDPLFANYTVGFGSGFATASKLTRVNNALSYVTPTFSGVTGYAMYSFQTDTTDDKNQVEGKSSADRYASLALRYQNASLEGILVADTTLYSNQRQGEKKHSDDGFTITVGGNYKFDSGLKFVTFYQYFQDQELNTAQRGGVAADGINSFTGNKGYGFVDGWGASFGVHYPVAGGTLKGQIAYRDMDNQHDVDFTRWTVAAGYDYSLSKRTAVYAMAGYSQEKLEQANKESATPNGYQIVFGTVHRF